MPRRTRFSIPGIPWHIIQRGNHRSVCFYAEEEDSVAPSMPRKAHASIETTA